MMSSCHEGSCTHEGGGGSSTSVHQACKGEGVSISKYACKIKKSLLHVLRNIFIYKVILSYFSLATSFNIFIQNILYDHSPVSQMLYSLFSMELLIACFKTHPLEMRGSQMGKSIYAMGGGGVVARAHVRAVRVVVQWDS